MVFVAQLLHENLLQLNKKGGLACVEELLSLLLRLRCKLDGPNRASYGHALVFKILGLRHDLYVDACSDVDYARLVVLFLNTGNELHGVVGFIEPLTLEFGEAPLDALSGPTMDHLYFLQLGSSVVDFDVKEGLIISNWTILPLLF